MPFRGKLFRGGQLILDDVAGMLKQDFSPTGLPSWSGYFTVTSAYIGAGGGYRLELDDGRAGDIIVNNVRTASGQPTIASFVVSGALQ